ncbi:MAG: hypothetical protein V9G20_31725 [Candidatus Promineifilaceae bacterium]
MRQSWLYSYEDVGRFGKGCVSFGTRPLFRTRQTGKGNYHHE